MIIAERQSRLRELLARRGMSDLDSLAAELRVSQSTVRRDVDALVDEGLVTRTHGGVDAIRSFRSFGPVTGWPLISSTTSPRFKPALAAGPSGDTSLMSAPFPGGTWKALARSGVTSWITAPR